MTATTVKPEQTKVRQRAEQIFNSPEREAAVRSETDAAVAALRAKTERLRALRLSQPAPHA